MLVLVTIVPQADAFIYWAESGRQTIGRANNDGSGVNDSFIHTGELPFAVAVDSSHIYWANQKSDSIGRANIDGTGVDNSFITGVKEPTGVAVNASFIFWASLAGGIGRAEINGAKPIPSLITAAVATQPCGLALDAGHVYWANQGTLPDHIGRAALDGGFQQPSYVAIEAFPCGVAVNSASIFWADFGFIVGGTRIGRANTSNGGGVDASFIGEGSTPCGVALDSASHLYWANAGSNTIGRANTDGTAVNQSFVATGSGGPCGVAVDSRSSPPGPEPPVQVQDVVPPQTKISKGPGKGLGDGLAKFSFKSSEAGSTFKCKLDGKKPARCKSPKAYKHLDPGPHTFKVWATDAAGNKDPTPAKRTFKVPQG